MYHQGHLKQTIRCKSGVQGFNELQEFLHYNDIKFVKIGNSNECYNHKIILEDVDIVFTFDGYRIDELLSILEERYLK